MTQRHAETRLTISKTRYDKEVDVLYVRLRNEKVVRSAASPARAHVLRPAPGNLIRFAQP
jgi:hypothetical protein